MTKRIYIKIQMCKNDIRFKYKISKSKAKKTINEVEYKAYNNFYCKFKYQKGEKDTYKFDRSGGIEL